MEFVTNIDEIRKRARRHIEEDPVTEGSRRLYFSDEEPRHAEGEKVKS